MKAKNQFLESQENAGILRFEICDEVLFDMCL